MAKIAVTILAALLALSVVISLFLYSENLKLSSQNLSLSEEIKTLKSANLTTAVGVVENPPDSVGNWWKNNYSYLWITGWVFNSGASMAKNAGIQVLAYDQANTVLMNYTVPIAGYGVFSINENKSLIPDYLQYLQLTPLEFGNVLSQENATVRLSIFHEGVFPNTTRYQVNPVWENIQ